MPTLLAAVCFGAAVGQGQFGVSSDAVTKLGQYKVLQEGDLIELNAMEKRSLNGCRGVVAQSVREYEQLVYITRVRCAVNEKVVKTGKASREQLRLLELAADDTEVYFVHKNASVEVTSVNWCRSKGHREVAPRVWAGTWWEKLADAERADALGRRVSALRTHREINGHGVLAAAVNFMDELPDLWDDGEDGGFSRFQISIHKRAKPEAEEPKAEL